MKISLSPETRSKTHQSQFQLPVVSSTGNSDDGSCVASSGLLVHSRLAAFVRAQLSELCTSIGPLQQLNSFLFQSF